MDKTDAHFFLEKLEQHMINFAPGLTLSLKEQLQRLYQCVKSMRDYLKMIEMEEQDPEVKELEMNIGDLVFDAENMVDFFFAGDGGGSEDVLATELARIEEEMESLRSEIERALFVDPPPVVGLEEKMDVLIRELDDEFGSVDTQLIVGLPGSGKTTLARKLYDDPRTEQIFEIRSWVTVSQKYQKRDLLIDLLNTSSSSTSPVSAEGSSDEQLGRELYLLLNHKRYLIVIDDIWSAEAWHQIRPFFPDLEFGSAVIFTSRTAIAAAALGMYTWRTKTHYLDPLSEEDSWKLLEATVFGNEGDSCPPELEEAGKHVAQQCAGLPISILEVGNILKKDKDKTPKRWIQISEAIVLSKSTNHDTLLLSYTHLPLHLKACFLYLGLFPENYEIPVRQLILLWIAEGFVTQQDENLEVTAQDYLNDGLDSQEDENLEVTAQDYLNDGLDSQEDENLEVTAQDYLNDGLDSQEDENLEVTAQDYLNDGLDSQEDENLEVTAQDYLNDGLDSQEDENLEVTAQDYLNDGLDSQEDENLEVTAQDYLNDLVDRNLVIVSRRRSNGEIKTCRIHRLLRAFSFQLGKEEKFLTHRRCYIGSPTVLEYSILSPSALKLRSFLCLTTPDKAPLDTPVFDENNFKLLKALDLISFRIPFPNDIGNLVLLKYLALWSEVSCLPPSVTKLLNLQTLILSTENTLTLPCHIWNMVKLRHLYNKKGALHFDTSLEATPTSPGQTSANILENLQTLHPLCCCNSCTELLVRTPNITKLGLSGNLITESGMLVIPDNLGLLEQLEILSCINTSVYLRSSTDPVKLVLPSCLKKLTLKNTLLKWEEISVLANLPNLEVLKLLDDACVVSGESSEAETDWDTSGLEFPQLKYLKMQRLDITKWNNADLLGFWNLKVLVLEECQQLQVIPLKLAQAFSLRTIEVTRCNPLVEECAKKIEEKHWSRRRFGLRLT